MTPRRSVALLCAVGTLALVALTAGPALGAGNMIIKDCSSKGQLTRQYPLGALRHALASMSATTRQYTNCQDVIQQAILAARNGHGKPPASGGGSGSSFLPTPVIIILVVLILAAVTFGALAIRRRRTLSEAAGGARGPDDGGTEGGVAKTRVMPATPAPDETARTRVMPSTPDRPRPEDTPDDDPGASSGDAAGDRPEPHR